MRVFIAIDLPENIKEEIYKIVKEIKGVRGKAVEKENLHITLKFLGELVPKKVEEIKNILRNISFQRFKIKIKGLGMFGNRVLWVGVSKGSEYIYQLHDIIEKELRKLGFVEDIDFHPHITIMRIKEITSKQDFNHFLERFRDIEIGEIEITEFSLKQSILRPQGPLYLDIEKYKLY